MSIPQPPFRDVTVGALLTRLAAAIPDREALIYPGRPRLTFSQLEQEARIVARGLMAVARYPFVGKHIKPDATTMPSHRQGRIPT